MSSHHGSLSFHPSLFRPPSRAELLLDPLFPSYRSVMFVPAISRFPFAEHVYTILTDSFIHSMVFLTPTFFFYLSFLTFSLPEGVYFHHTLSDFFLQCYMLLGSTDSSLILFGPTYMLHNNDIALLHCVHKTSISS